MSADPPGAVLVDFGGVLTTDVFDAFRLVSSRVSGDPGLIERLFRTDSAAARLLAEHERGRIGEAEFEAGFVSRMRTYREVLVPGGLIDDIHSQLSLDEHMIAAMRRIRQDGIPVALVSNSLGDDGYRSVHLPDIVDVAVISREVAARKPERRIYETACAALDVAPERCVMIDDLEHNLTGAARIGIHGIHHTDTAATIATLEHMFGIDMAQNSGAE